MLLGLVLEKEHIIQAFKHAEVLEVSEHLQRVFLQSVSHELETPLSAIQTGLDVLVRQVEGGRRAQEDTRRAASGCAPTGSGDQ